MNDVYNKCVLKAELMLNGIHRFKREFCIGYDVWRETEYPGYFCTIDGKIAQIYFNEYGELKKFLLMNIEQTENGYQRVEIHFKNSNPPKKAHISIHRIVYDTWKDYLQEGLVIDHIDCNHSNNHVNNLQQILQSENIQRAVDMGHFYQNVDRQKKLLVFDNLTGQECIYNSVRDFLVSIGAPEYMISHGGLSSLQKRKDYMKRYKVSVLDKG